MWHSTCQNVPNLPTEQLATATTNFKSKYFFITYKVADG